MSHDNLLTLLGRNCNQTNFESDVPDLLPYPNNTQNLIAKMIKDCPQSLTITKSNNSAIIEKTKNCFSETFVVTKPFIFDQYKNVTSIESKHAKYKVDFTESCLKLSNKELNLYDSEQTILSVEDSFRKASGIIHVVHSKSTNQSLIDFIVRKFDELGSKSVKVYIKNKDAKIRLCDEIDIQVTIDELILNLQMIECKRVILDVTYCADIDIIAKALSELGCLVMVIKNGQTSVHEFARLRADHPSETINSNLISVIGLQSLPTINFDKVKKAKFIDTELYTYFKKFDSSPTSKEEIGVYGHTSYLSEIITGSVDLVDFIPVPENIVEQQSVRMSAYDIYVMFKSKGYIFNLDKSLSLSRRKLLTIDLIDLFIKRF